MKKMVICLLAIFVFVAPLYAETSASQQQTGGAAVPGGQMQMKCPMMKMPMMQGGDEMQGMMHMCPRMCSRMGHRIGHGMMARDMMQIMMDVIKIQQKIIRGLSPVEKKELMKDTDRMLDKMGKMMSDMRDMMMHGMIDQSAPLPSKEPENKETEKEAPPKADPHKH